jgi:hypothetical protein
MKLERKLKNVVMHFNFEDSYITKERIIIIIIINNFSESFLHPRDLSLSLDPLFIFI